MSIKIPLEELEKEYHQLKQRNSFIKVNGGVMKQSDHVYESALKELLGYRHEERQRNNTK